MKTKTILVMIGLGLFGAVGAMAATGRLPLLRKAAVVETASIDKGVPPIAVTVAKATPFDFVETVLVTGSLVPREEVLVGPEVEGLRITEVLADEGQRVTKGQVLARLVSDTLEAQLAQNTAAMARAGAAIAQAQSNIVSADARLLEARNSYDRGKPLKTSGYLSESGMDQRLTAAKTAEAALASARDGLKLAEADKAQIEAQRREITWRRGRTDIVAPTDGIISRRLARIGGFAAGANDSMFRIIAKGEIELDAEATETRISKIKVGQSVQIVAGSGEPVVGTVRIVSPEIDRSTRLGRIRVFIGDRNDLRIGAFARGTIETAKSRGLAVPVSAVLYSQDLPSVQVVVGGIIKARSVKLGLEQAGLIEVVSGLTEGEMVVAKSGTFLREGDAVRGIVGEARRNGVSG